MQKIKKIRTPDFNVAVESSIVTLHTETAELMVEEIAFWLLNGPFET